MPLTVDICTRPASVLPSLSSLSGHTALAVLDSQTQGERHLGFPSPQFLFPDSRYREFVYCSLQGF